MNKTVWVAGEALIDLITQGDAKTPVVGGGPANTAKAIARLGYETKFIGGISTDEFGSVIERELLDSGVNLSLVKRSELPTALAIATIDESGKASYEFELENTATFDFELDWLPTDKVHVLHIGSVATVFEPGASVLLEWAKAAAAVIVFDPNVRPAIEGDKALYRAAVERWVELSTVVKLSEDDLAWLYEGEEAAVIQRWLEKGVELVVVTRAEAGLRAYAKEFLVDVPAVKIELIDSIGAGDTIGAVVVEGLLRHGVAGLNKETVTSILERAARAAAITCSRAGANPPWKSEL